MQGLDIKLSLCVRYSALRLVIIFINEGDDHDDEVLLSLAAFSTVAFSPGAFFLSGAFFPYRCIFPYRCMQVQKQK